MGSGFERGCAAGLLAALIAGCAARGPVPTAQPSSQADLIVLLPDPGTGAVGRADVSNNRGRVTLAGANAATRIATNTSPSAAAPLMAADVASTFGDALAQLPPAPRHFTLYFRFDSEALTEDSQRLVQDVLREVAGRPAPEVTAIGYTDRTGQTRANIELGLRRANAVRTLLVTAGLPAAAVEVASHGEAELLVPTADGVFEPRNRRVEVTVR